MFKNDAMKTHLNKLLFFLSIIIVIILQFPNKSNAQILEEHNMLEQNISIYAEDEPLSNIIERICEYLNIDYSYNSQLVGDKKISLNISNKPIRYVLEELMKDFYLIFDIQDDILIVRDYIPLNESLSYEYETSHFLTADRGFFFNNPRKKSIKIDFKTASNLIIIPVRINDSDTLNFILDTGVNYPIITELSFVNNLSLNYLVPIQINVLGEDSLLNAYRSGNNLLEIEGMTASNQGLLMVIEEDFQISHIIGMPVHGLIGFNIFKDYIVEIDYDNEVLTLYKPEYYKYRDRQRDIILPLHFEGNKPFVTTTVEMEDGTDVPVKLLVDTGASDALWLAEESDDRISLPENILETFLGRGLGGDVYGRKGRIGGIWVGPMILPEPITSFPESELMTQLITTNDRNGTLGAEILRRFFVTIDYRNNRLTLRPSSRVHEDFNYNMSGMEVINPAPGLPIFTVSNITEDSPAYFAGVQEDDQIISLNSNHHTNLSLNDINLLLQSRENKTIRLKLLRDGETIKTKFDLEKLF